MARPPLSERSFLAAVFSPKKNPIPIGLRKRKLVGVKGRSASRLRSYNGMSALNQSVLDRAGQREAYLRGDVTIAQAKRSLRNAAVDLGIAKPLKPKVAPVHSGNRADRHTRVINHLYQQLSGTVTRKPVNVGALRRGTLMMSQDQLTRALRMAAPEIKAASRDPDEVVDYDGKNYNPFWYH